MLETTYFDLKKYEGSDILNPLQVENPNMDVIDGAMRENEVASIGTATETLAGTVHNIVRSKPDTPMFRFTSTSDFTFGDSFTVDGIAYTGKMVDGSQMSTGAFVTGVSVLCCLVEDSLTFYVAGGGTAPDSEKLGGNEPSYYASAESVSAVDAKADENSTNIASINNKLTNLITGTLSAGATTVTLIDSRITTTSIIEPWVYVPTGETTTLISPTAMSVSSGQCTLTYEEQEVAYTVGVRVF